MVNRGRIFVNKMEIEKSLYFANKAAGVVVGKVGTSTINKKELFENALNINNKSNKSL